jgi:transcriptional regulator
LTFDKRADTLVERHRERSITRAKELAVPVESNDVLQGTLDMLILKALSLEPMHGWGVAQRIQQISRNVLQVNQGSLYPALHRLEDRGWIAAEWGTSENNRKAKYYHLTTTGERQLTTEAATWRRFATMTSVPKQSSWGRPFSMKACRSVSWAEWRCGFDARACAGRHSSVTTQTST